MPKQRKTTGVDAKPEADKEFLCGKLQVEVEI
jgi:hypothetical protein